MPGTFAERLRKLGTLIDVVRAAPRMVDQAPCQEIVETAAPSLAGAADLAVLARRRRPLHHAARRVHARSRSPARATSACIACRSSTIARSACTGRRTRAAPSTSARREQASARMPVAIALGGDPAMIYAASAPLPPGVDEVVFAGWLRGARRRDGARAGRSISRCRRSAEIVLEGWVDPSERRLEGPFGDHTGYYSLARDYPVFHLTAVTRRARPDLSHDDRRAAAAGGLLARQGHRAASSCRSCG